MTYIVPKSFQEDKIYLNKHNDNHKIYYSLKDLRLMGIPFLLSRTDYECKDGKIYLINKDKIDIISKIDTKLSSKIINYSSLLKRNLNGYLLGSHYKYINYPKEIYLCVYKIVNNIPQIYIVDR